MVDRRSEESCLLFRFADQQDRDENAVSPGSSPWIFPKCGYRIEYPVSDEQLRYEDPARSCWSSELKRSRSILSL